MTRTRPSDAEVVAFCWAVVEEAGVEQKALTNSTFLDFADDVKDIIVGWPAARRNHPEVLRMLEGLRELRGDLEARVTADPPILYRPQHKAVLEFHQSDAMIRYFCAPNRSSKTQAAVQEIYWTVTDSHPYLKHPKMPANCALVCSSFSGQGAAVYESKYIYGEGGNPLSPAFPAGGKWLYRWDDKKRAIYIACPACAEANKAGSCRHTKSVIRMFSAEEAVQLKTQGRTLSIAGGQYARVHLDEQIPKVFFTESLMRIATVANSSILVTETPLGGKGFWTNTLLRKDAESGARVEGSERLVVSLHTCTAYETGLQSKEEIDGKKSMMSEEEAEARIYGRPASFSETGVFDKIQISSMLEQIREGKTPRGKKAELFIRSIVPLDPEAERKQKWDEKFDGSNVEDLLKEAGPDTVVQPVYSDDGRLTIYVPPKRFAQYVIGADVAQGLRDGDYSCAQVLEMTMDAGILCFEQAATLHGWMNSFTFGVDLYKLGLFYNGAWVSPERRGPGDATILKLKELGCYLLFRDQTNMSSAEHQLDSRFGVDTNVATKAPQVSILQNVVWNRRTRRRYIKLYDLRTVEEMGSYGQEKLPAGGFKFRGESGTPDDTVSALAVGVYTAVSYDLFDHQLAQEAKEWERRRAEGKAVEEVDKRFWKEQKKEFDPWNRSFSR